MDREAWQVIVHGVAKESDTTQRLNNNKKTNKLIQGLRGEQMNEWVKEREGWFTPPSQEPVYGGGRNRHTLKTGKRRFDMQLVELNQKAQF